MTSALRRASEHCIALLAVTWRIWMLSAGIAPASAADQPANAPVLKEGNGRIVFVGDSITGLGRNFASGFAHQIEWALKASYPGCQPELVALGGSGAGVTAWLNTLKRSRTEDFPLDVKGIVVRQALQQPADGLVVLLGMNDVLAPYVVDTSESLQRWTANYRELVAGLRNRVHPKVVCLATVTMNTEDSASPKNAMIAKLNERLKGLADELGCRLLDTGETVEDVLRQGRRVQPDFHVTYDFVHPNEAGHIGIAVAMLRGLGEQQASRRLAAERLGRLLRKIAGEGPNLSYALTPIVGSLASDRQSFRLHYWWTAKSGHSTGTFRVRLGGEGWEVTPKELVASDGEFVATGVLYPNLTG